MSDRILRDVSASQGALYELTTWQLAGFESAATMMGDASWQARLRAERDRRRLVPQPAAREGVLPASGPRSDLTRSWTNEVPR